MVVCEIIDGDKILLKNNVRGISEGKWLGPGGKVDNGESLEEATKREVFEETGLSIDKLSYHGLVTSEMNGNSYTVHFFSTRTFSGTLRSTAEGEVRWFDVNSMPYSKMWPEAKFLYPLIFDGKSFLAKIKRDDSGENILELSIRKIAGEIKRP